MMKDLQDSQEDFNPASVEFIVTFHGVSYGADASVLVSKAYLKRDYIYFINTAQGLRIVDKRTGETVVEWSPTGWVSVSNV